jgi:hypothetical protein
MAIECAVGPAIVLTACRSIPMNSIRTNQRPSQAAPRSPGPCQAYLELSVIRERSFAKGLRSSWGTVGCKFSLLPRVAFAGFDYSSGNYARQLFSAFNTVGTKTRCNHPQLKYCRIMVLFGHAERKGRTYPRVRTPVIGVSCTDLVKSPEIGHRRRIALNRRSQKEPLCQSRISFDSLAFGVTDAQQIQGARSSLIELRCAFCGGWSEHGDACAHQYK